MKAGWLVFYAAIFYLVVVALFWPIERQVLPPAGTVTDRQGYQHRVVLFSDNRVFARVPMTTALQEQGLGGVRQLDDEEGMLWIFPTPQRATFWMKGMVIPLDFIWIRNDRIVEITEQVPPPADPAATNLPILEVGVPVDAVLEVAGGFVQRHTIRVGDQVGGININGL